MLFVSVNLECEIENSRILDLIDGYFSPTLKEKKNIFLGMNTEALLEAGI